MAIRPGFVPTLALAIVAGVLLTTPPVDLEALAQEPRTAARTASKTEARTAETLTREGTAAYDRKEYALSGKLLAEAIAAGDRSSDNYYNAACSFALASEKDRAFEYLDGAIKVGFRNTSHLRRDSDLESLHADPRWAGVVAASEKAEARYLDEHRNPARVKFVTEDINRFWAAYDKAMAAAAEERAAVFQRDYIDPGTIGLKDFARSGRLNAKALTAKLGARAEFFKAIRTLTLGIESERAETLKAFSKLKDLYPEAIFPDAYFVIGQMQSGGTASNNGLLMGAEMFTRAEGVPFAELSDWEKGAIMQRSEIAPLVAHEAIHFQQRYSGNSMLCHCLREGSADFLGELTSGRLILRMQETHKWADARERELWEEFQKEMTGPTLQRWFAAGLKEGRPADLGYWMGYKISEAYYRQAADKREAVRAMLVVRDCQEFLKASGYAGKFGR